MTPWLSGNGFIRIDDKEHERVNGTEQERRAGEMLKLLAERDERAGRGAPCEMRRMSYVILCYYGPPALAGE
jgi:hypothetical protein